MPNKWVQWLALALSSWILGKPWLAPFRHGLITMKLSGCVKVSGDPRCLKYLQNLFIFL